MQPLVLHPIGVIHTPFADRASAPRQGNVGEPVRGRIELFPGHNYHHGLEDLESWRYIWVLFWFHLNDGWRPKVRPPRSAEKKGVFATRSPHRPNPIGMSVVELLSIEGRNLHVSGVDMVDGTPVLDVKPYVPYADAVVANSGWLGENDADAGTPDPGPHYTVAWSQLADAQLDWLQQRSGLQLRDAMARRLALGPGHHYRRTWQEGEDLVMAYRSWRLRCQLGEERILVKAIVSGYREGDLHSGPSTPQRWPEDAVALHAEFEAWSRGREP